MADQNKQIRPDIERNMFNSIAEAIGAGLVIIDTTFRIRWMNQKLRELIDFKTDPIGCQCHKVFYERETPCTPCIMLDCIESGQVCQRETSGETPFHPDRHLKVTCAPFISPEGDVSQVIQLIQDTTGARISQTKETYWQEFFLKIVFNAPVGVLTMDTSGVILSWNRYMEDTYGIPAPEILGLNLFDRFPAMRKEGLEARVEEVIRTQQPVLLFDWRHKSRNRGVRLIDIMIYPLLDETGSVFAISSINNDVTERSRMQHELQQTKDFLGNLFNTVTDFIIIADLDGNIIDANRATADIFHYNKKDFAEHKLSVLFRNPTECEGFIETLRRDSNIENLEIDFTDKQAAIHNVILSASRMSSFPDSPDLLAITGKDVTELKTIQEKIMRVQRLNALGELASGVAHDFNNLLAVILGRSQILMKNTSETKVLKGLEVIERAARHGSETIKRIQSFARKHSDREHFKSIDVNEILSEAIEFTRTRWKLEARSHGSVINLFFNPGNDSTVFGHYHELLEVFTNLILNAVDAMPNGGDIAITSEATEDGILISFNDTGVGMAQDVKHRIFDPFFTTKGMKGTGLGLSVSYGIIQRHGGAIEVFSEIGRGSTFWVKLPNKEAFSADLSLDHPLHSGPKILVVEDDPDVRDLIVEILESRGYPVRCASNANHAIEMLEIEPADVLYSDLKMPGLSGWDVVSASYSTNPNVTVALVTGWASQVREEDMKRYRVHTLIAKPFTENDILDVLRIAAENEIQRHLP